jgi:hypothetical protein
MSKNQTIEKLKDMRLNTMAGMHQHHLQNNMYNDVTEAGWLPSKGINS